MTRSVMRQTRKCALMWVSVEQNTWYAPRSPLMTRKDSSILQRPRQVSMIAPPRISASEVMMR